MTNTSVTWLSVVVGEVIVNVVSKLEVEVTVVTVKEVTVVVGEVIVKVVPSV